MSLSAHQSRNEIVSVNLIQSYVQSTFYVSTILRASSAAHNPLPYYETLVCEWDRKTRLTGKIVGEHYSGQSRRAAMLHHAEVCEKLMFSVPEPQLQTGG